MLLFLIMLLNLSPAKKAIMLSPLQTPVKVITFPLILEWKRLCFFTGEKIRMRSQYTKGRIEKSLKTFPLPPPPPNGNV